MVISDGYCQEFNVCSLQREPRLRYECCSKLNRLNSNCNSAACDLYVSSRGNNAALLGREVSDCDWMKTPAQYEHAATQFNRISDQSAENRAMRRGTVVDNGAHSGLNCADICVCHRARPRRVGTNSNRCCLQRSSDRGECC